jgi:hypothetical protein
VIHFAILFGLKLEVSYFVTSGTVASLISVSHKSLHDAFKCQKNKFHPYALYTSDLNPYLSVSMIHLLRNKSVSPFSNIGCPVVRKLLHSVFNILVIFICQWDIQTYLHRNILHKVACTRYDLPWFVK